MVGRETEKAMPIVVIVVVAVVIVGAFSMMIMTGGYWGGGYGWRGMMGSGMMGWSGMGYGWWMPLGGLIFLVALVAGLYLILTSFRKPQESSRALDILKERYAKGEITEEQFEKMRKGLNQ